MSDKSVAFLVTALAVAPVCALCILGPAVVLSGLAGWIGGLGPVGAAGVAIAVAAIVLGFVRWRNRARPGRGPADRRLVASTSRDRA